MMGSQMRMQISLQVSGKPHLSIEWLGSDELLKAIRGAHNPTNAANVVLKAEALSMVAELVKAMFSESSEK